MLHLSKRKQIAHANFKAWETISQRAFQIACNLTPIIREKRPVITVRFTDVAVYSSVVLLYL